MAGTAITTIYDYVDDYVDGASDETSILNRAILSTARVFCRQSHLWKETLPDITVVADTAGYTLTAPTNYGDAVEIDGLDEVQYKEDGMDDDQYAPLTIKSREYLDAYEKNWEWRTAPQPEACFYDHLDGKIYLTPTPDTGSTDGLVVRLWLMPHYTATEIPPFLFTKYIDQLARGTAGRMMQMTNQRWSNPELGDAYWHKFLRDCQNAQRDQDRGFADIENYRVIPEPGHTGSSKHRSRGGLF